MTVLTVGASADYDYSIPDYNGVAEAINEALDNAQSGDEVVVESGRYLVVDGRTNLAGVAPDVTLRPSGNKPVELVGSNPNNWVMGNFGDSKISNFRLKGFKFDLAFTRQGHGLRAWLVDDCVFEDIEITNGVDCWELSMGVPDSATSTVINQRNLFKNAKFGKHFGTLEQLLVFNSNHTVFEGDLQFQDNVHTGPSFGIWQRVTDIQVPTLKGRDCGGKLCYINLSSSNIAIGSIEAQNCGTALRVGGLSDNGSLGATQINGLNVGSIRSVGGELSDNSPGIRVGSSNAAGIGDVWVEGHGYGAVIDAGEAADQENSNLTIGSLTVKNNNPSGANPDLRPCVLFQEPSPTTRILGGSLEFDSTSTTSRRGFAFTGGHTYSDIKVYGVDYPEDPTANAFTDGGSTLDASVDLGSV